MVTLYRCQTCGKWSHASRRPSRHQRFISAAVAAAPAEFIEYIPAEYDHMNGFTADGGWRVWCGPFDTYRAEKVS
jgi:hypothetical protein